MDYEAENYYENNFYHTSNKNRRMCTDDIIENLDEVVYDVVYDEENK